MNLPFTKNFSNLTHKILINHCQYKNKSKLLLCNNIKIYLIRSKTTNPTLYEVRRNAKRSINIYGYFLLVVPISTFFLGTWQLQRRQWKLKLIEDLQTRINAEPIDLVENINQLDSLEYYTVKAKGKFLHEKEFLVGPRSVIHHNIATDTGNLFSRRNTNGWNVITPFKIENQDLTILVNRGWISEKAKNLPLSKIEDTIEINGIVRKEESRPAFNPSNKPKYGIWYYRDVTAMAKMADTSPIFIDLWSVKDPPEGPLSCQTRITLRNEHFSYMVTWYTLSLCTATMWYKIFVKKLPLA
ncbi:surfeit locus protein 1 isoform X1 [Vespa crabro]|uniref:surfeit locus protein 1 isoform X1 n=1 Tax=Vespa crabro TaxID=7445 RepID=UPI001F029D9D|nr:surfeit locus protein 1 isoform X1 [Vespa crabro]